MGLPLQSYNQLVTTVVIAVVVAGSSGQLSCNLKFSRGDFPSEFVFGAGSSAYQIEGAAAEDGRTPSIWDVYTHAGKALDKSTADITADDYHKYKEDVKIMSDIGLEAYRFSISWSRLLPNGRGAVNQKGLQFYNDLIDELVCHGIEPHVTLYHLDLPQVLEDEYEGWLSPKIIEDFTEYADVCFREFGDRVSHWTTLNELNIMALAGYGTGEIPPQRCSQPGGLFNCTAGNSSIEPYIVMHHALLAHASAVALYRKTYQMTISGSHTTKKVGPPTTRGQIKARAIGRIFKSAIILASFAGEAVGLRKNRRNGSRRMLSSSSSAVKVQTLLRNS